MRKNLVHLRDSLQKHFPNFAIVKHLELQQLKIFTYPEISGFFSAQITLFAIIIHCEVPLLCEDLLSQGLVFTMEVKEYVNDVHRQFLRLKFKLNDAFVSR